MSPVRKPDIGNLPKTPRERGFTMIEVLVTFVILAVGVLGIVSLLVTSKTSEFEASQRARAVSLADGLLEQIRANTSVVASTYAPGSDPNNPVVVLPTFVDLASATTAPANCIGASCTPAALATRNLWDWKSALVGAPVTVVNGGSQEATAGLPGVTSCVVFTPYPPKVVVGQPPPNTGLLQILVQWQGLRETTDGVGPGDVNCGGALPENDDRRRAVTVSTFIVDEGDI